MHVLHSICARHGIPMVMLNARATVTARQCHLLQEARHHSAQTLLCETRPCGLSTSNFTLKTHPVLQWDMVPGLCVGLSSPQRSPWPRAQQSPPVFLLLALPTPAATHSAPIRSHSTGIGEQPPHGRGCAGTGDRSVSPWTCGIVYGKNYIVADL